MTLGKQKEKIVYDFLDKYIQDRLVNPPVVIINNYKNKTAKTSFLELVDAIEKDKLIIGGDGVLYIQHDLMENPLIGFILHVMQSRKLKKKERDLYEKNSDEWVACDITQLNLKILINALYGVIGYKKFLLTNRFIAQSITNQGKQIITTAVCTFENFLSDNVNFVTFSEMMTYVANICNEYASLKEKYGSLRTDVFDCEGDFRKAVVNRILKKCAFVPSENHIRYLTMVINNCSEEELFLLYFKNNLHEFNKLSFVKEKLNYALRGIAELKKADISDLDEEIQQVLNSLLEFYQIFVVYDYPIYDRVRRAMFTEKKSVLYVDTDSNFLGLSPLLTSLKRDSIEANINKTEDEINIQICNIFLYYCQHIVNRSLKTMGLYMNVKDEWAAKIQMKNEFYIGRILFAKQKKKRYIADLLIQEGKEITKDNTEIKGFDFKKSTTKEIVKKFYTELCNEYILRSKEIRIPMIYKELILFRKEIERSMKQGESIYFRQMNVKKIEHYKSPYTTQQVPAVILWNVLYPEYAIELPSDVNIVPIKELGAKKKRNKDGEEILDFNGNPTLNWFRENYPIYYDRLETEIFENQNKSLRRLSLGYLALPKNPDIPLPEFFQDIVNTDKITSDTIGLFLPIMESLGVRPQKGSSTQSYLSNIISL